MNNILTQLKADHREIKSLLNKIDQATGAKAKQSAFERLREVVITHAKSEESALYDELKSHQKDGEARDLALEGYEEHHVADILINELSSLPSSDERWTAKFSVLKESLEHHIKEEEGDMFKQAKKLLEQKELKEAGAKFSRLIVGARKSRSKSAMGTKLRTKIQLVAEGVRL